MDYALTNLGDREFEHLSQALALSVLGPGVGVFGDGPDGGREAAWNGAVNFPHPGAETWDGPGVLQAKFRTRPLGAGKDLGWATGQIRRELNTWANPRSRRSRERGLPDYLIVATNVVLTPGVGGGVEAVEELIGSYAERLGLRGWDVWHHDKLCRMVDLRPELLRTYAALITPSTLIAQLLERLGGTPATVGPRIAAQTAKDLTAKQWVRLSEVGEAENQRITLGDIAVDLPARRGDGQPVAGVVAHLITHGDALLRPSCGRPQHPRLALVGGPCQGKSTLTQLLCQANRVALLDGLPEPLLGPAAAALHPRLQRQLHDIGLPTPRLLRWPLQIELSDFAEYLAGGEDHSLLGYLAQVVSRRSPQRVTAGDLQLWMHAWPCLLVLDGLDEVPAAAAREAIDRKLEEFLVDAGHGDADLMIVATTRPQGYDGEFTHFEHLTLDELDPAGGQRFAERLSTVRHADDPDLADRVLTRLRAAAADAATARLMKSPLQIAIMSLILERRESAPQDRYALFEAYYDTIYRREAAKPGHLAALLAQQQSHVDHLHQQAGLVLQVRAEHAEDAQAALPRGELRSLALQRYRDEGFDPARAAVHADQLLRAATDRLVLLVPVGADLGFEVRSLQEFMAAGALSTGPGEQVLQRLTAVAPSSYWRNTWLFAAGRLFARAEHRRSDLVALLGDLDADPHASLNALVLPGAQLALDLLDEDVAVSAPLYQRRFAQQALRLVDLPPGPEVAHLAATLHRVCESDPEARTVIEGKLRHSLDTWPARLTVLTIWAHWSTRTGVTAAAARSALRRAVAAGPRHAAAEADLAHLAPGNILSPFLDGVPDDPAVDRCLAAAVRDAATAQGADPTLLRTLDPVCAALADVHPRRRIRSAGARRPAPHITVPDAALADPDVRDLLTLVAFDLGGRDWPAAADLRRVLTVWSLRQPVRAALLVT